MIHALEKSGRQGEILSLCESEAKITGSWERLVGFLIKQDQPEKARLAAETGIKALGDNFPGVTRSLRQTIADLAAKQGDYRGILLLKQEDFLGRPDLSSFEALLQASIKTKNKSEMRVWALHFLEMGKAKASGALKETYRPKAGSRREFPQYEVLIDIAAKEKRIDDVWDYYQKAVQNKRHFHSHAKVAKIVKDKYPDESLRIWRGIAEKHIAQTNPAAYVTAVSYLKEAQKVYLKSKRDEEWAAYVDKLKEINKRKPRFIKELRRLTGEKLL